VEQPNSRTEMPVFFAGGDRRKRGRPRVSERKVPVTTFVPPAYYDRITKIAAAQGEHVSVLLCDVLIKAFAPRPK
jgi:hypothetical protein